MVMEAGVSGAVEAGGVGSRSGDGTLDEVVSVGVVVLGVGIGCLDG